MSTTLKKLAQRRLPVVSQPSSETSQRHFLHVDFAREDKVQVLDAVRSGNPLLDKIGGVFGVLEDEVDALGRIARTHFYPYLALFGEDTSIADHTLMGNALLVFVDMHNFVLRLHQVVVNLVQQVSSLFNHRQKVYTNTFAYVKTGQHFCFLHALAKALTILIHLDALIVSQPRINECWIAYKECMTENEDYNLERMMVDLNRGLMCGNCFEACISQDFESNGKIRVRENFVFLKMLQKAVTFRLVDEYAAQHSDLMATASLYALMRRLLPARIQPDAKLFHLLWKTVRARPLQVLTGRAVWMVDKFIRTHCQAPPGLTRLSPRDPKELRRGLMDKLDQTVKHEVQVLEQEAARLFSRASSKRLWAKLDTIQAGLFLATRAKRLLTQFLSLHVMERVPLRRSNVLPLVQLVVLLKKIQAQFINSSSRHIWMREATPMLLHKLKQRLNTLLAGLRMKLDAVRTPTALSENKSNGLHLLDSALKYQTLTVSRLLVAQMGAAIIGEDFSELLQSMRSLFSWEEALEQSCDCLVLFWHSNELFPPCLKAFARHTDLPHLIHAFSLNDRLFQGALKQSHSERVTAMLEKHLFMPLCNEIETALRLQRWVFLLLLSNCFVTLKYSFVPSTFLHILTCSCFQPSNTFKYPS